MTHAARWGGARDEVTRDPVDRASEAMDRYASGEETAFSDLYEALSPRLFGFLLRLSGEPSTAEDLLQQTFLQMHDARARFVQGANVAPWAMAIGRRLYIDMLRRTKGRATDIVASDVIERMTVSPTTNPEEWLIAHETEAAIDAGLATLKPSQREAFRLIKQEGLSVADAAAVLGTTSAAVKLRAHRAYRHLRATLGAVGRTR